jgi:hypothetical protein
MHFQAEKRAKRRDGSFYEPISNELIHCQIPCPVTCCPLSIIGYVRTRIFCTMPLYTIHVSHKSIANFTSFAKALAELHGKTFNTDPLAVRVMRSRDSEDLDYYVGLSLHPVNLVLA